MKQVIEDCTFYYIHKDYLFAGIHEPCAVNRYLNQALINSITGKCHTCSKDCSLLLRKARFILSVRSL